MNTMIGKDYLATLTAGLSALMADGLKALFGAALDRPVLGAVTWNDLIATLCLVLLVLLVNGLAAALLRRMIKVAAKTNPKGFEHRFFGTP